MVFGGCCVDCPLRASLHVLLAALVDPIHDAHQVELESWRRGNQTWRVYLGPIVQHGSSLVANEYGKLLDRLKVEFPQLSDEPQWLRVFFMKNGRDKAGVEALLDNLCWTEGRQIVAAWEFPEGNYRLRHF